MKEEFNNSSVDRVARILARLEAVPAGQHIAEFIRDNAVKIDLQKDPVNWAASTAAITDVKDGLYSYTKPVIILKEGLSDDNLLQAIIHETQHLRQHYGHTGNPDRILSQGEYILFYRAAEADAQATCTDVAWKLKQAGDAGPWNATAYVGYQDICTAYEKAVSADPAAADDGRAKRAAFDAWFDSPGRLAGYNAATVDYMIPFLAAGRKIFKNHNMSEGKLDALWIQRLHDISPEPYLKTSGGALLNDPRYRRDLDTRPPEDAAQKKPKEKGPKLAA